MNRAADDVPNWAVVAQVTARATGSNFVIGCYPHRDDWFANCDGIEWQGSTPEQAVRSVVLDIQKRTRTEKARALIDTGKAESKLGMLDAAVDVIGKEPASAE